jgi:hypothetical protein
MKSDEVRWDKVVEWWVEFKLSSHFILQEANRKTMLVAMGGEYVQMKLEIIVARRGRYM